MANPQLKHVSHPPIDPATIGYIDHLHRDEQGAVQLIMQVDYYLSNMADDQLLLITKLNHYLAYIKDDLFTKKFGASSIVRTSINILFATRPHPHIVELLQILRPRVLDYKADLTWVLP